MKSEIRPEIYNDNCSTKLKLGYNKAPAVNKAAALRPCANVSSRSTLAQLPLSTTVLISPLDLFHGKGLKFMHTGRAAFCIPRILPKNTASFYAHLLAETFGLNN